MEIRVTRTKDFIDGYLDLLKKFYQGNPAYDYYKSDTLRGIDYCFAESSRNVFFIEVVSGSKTLGHIALITDQNFPPHQAYFGFFECIEDVAVFRKLWKELIKVAKIRNITTLFGPVNGSIWYPYRVISMNTSESYFPSEPLTQHFYYTWLKHKGPEREIVYHSGYRTNYDGIITHTKNAYDSAVKSGISIESGLIISPDIIQQIFRLSSDIFKKSWGFTPLTANDFKTLYSSNKLDSYLGSLYIVKKEDTIIGFCSNLKYKNTVIMKTVGIDPDFQLQGIGNALVHKVHVDAARNKTDKVIYALIRKENNVKYFPTDEVEVIREYSAFEFSI